MGNSANGPLNGMIAEKQSAIRGLMLGLRAAERDLRRLCFEALITDRIQRPEDALHLSEAQAREVFAKLRWPMTEGAPQCPLCDSDASYDYKCRPIIKCQVCGETYSLTSNTVFVGRKMPFRYILAIVAYANKPMKHRVSVLKLAEALNVQWRSASGYVRLLDDVIKLRGHLSCAFEPGRAT